MKARCRYNVAVLGGLLTLTSMACGEDPSDLSAQLGETSQAVTGVSLEDALAPRSIVDDDGKQCPRAKFKTIQAAVDAATKGDTILVCAGTYRENATIRKTVTLLGAQHGVDGRTRRVNPAAESLIVTGAFTVAADNVVFDGFSLQAVFAEDQDEAFGLFLDEQTSGARVINNVMGGEAGALFLGSSGIIQTVIRHNKFTGRGVFGSNTEPPDHARNERIEENTFDQASLTFVGSGHRDLLILNNLMTGGGSLSLKDNVFPSDMPPQTRRVTVAGNTIVGSTGPAIALRHVSDAQISGNVLQGGRSAGFLIVGMNSRVLVEGNSISGFAAAGIQAGDLPPEGVDQEVTTGLTAEGNTVANDARGIALFFSRGNLFSQNVVADSRVVGIDVNASSHNNKFQNNQVSHSRQLDCQDRSRGGGTSQTDDEWVGNIGSTSSPPGLCVRRR